ncbi:MAG: response regulator transcription factor [Pyrinomonadaceae bacterium]
MRILLVESDARNSKLLRKALTASTYAVDRCETYEDAQYRRKVNDYDLIVLEVQLPDRDGVELCEEIRLEGDNTPILILTVRGEVEDKIRGLDAGADDYLAKPFELGEFMARVRALLRRPRNGSMASVITIGELSIDTRSQKVLGQGISIPLTNKEYSMLEYFARNFDRVIGREEISEHVWDENFDPFSNVIEVYINRLRHKLLGHVTSPILRTRRGSGYILEYFADEIIK